MDISLRNLKPGSIAIVSSISAQKDLARRIRDLGIVKNAKISLIGKAPLFDPLAIKVNNTVITLRNKEADYIFVKEIGNTINEEL